MPTVERVMLRSRMCSSHGGSWIGSVEIPSVSRMMCFEVACAAPSA
jgi:hypothetical protein